MKTPFSLALASCLLFVPGNRPDRFAKALAASPDGIIIDLEDAVAAVDKSTARASAAAFLTGRGDSDGPPVLVRINALGSRAALDDLTALADGALRPDGLLLPKVEEPRDIDIVRLLDRRIGSGECPLLAMIETAHGLDHAAAVAASLGTIGALGFGGADLAAELGAAMAWEPLLQARSSLVRAAAIGGVALFDVPFFDIAALDTLTEETRRVRALGFTGKLAIHPNQVAPIHAAFAPSADEIARAERIVAVAQNGVTVVDGHMVDAPVIAAARRVLTRAARTS